MIPSLTATRRAALAGPLSRLPRVRPRTTGSAWSWFSHEGPKLKAFLLAAGHGTRLRPLTDKTAKCLLPVRGVPMLQIWLDIFSRFCIDEVLINIHAHAGLVRDFLRNHPNSDTVRVVEERELLAA